MMRVLVTGAGGFIGQALIAALLRGDLAHVNHLVRVDTHLPELPEHNPTVIRVQGIQGSIGDAGVLDRVFSQPVDLVFHLAGLTSRAAQEDWAQGLAANVEASMRLLQALERQPRRQSPPPRLVFASSIAVFGPPLPPRISDDTAPEPVLSYGCQKRMVELLVADGTQRGFINGCSLRLPAVIARPAQAQQALSAFSSNILRTLAAGQPYLCPVSQTASHWLLSLPCAVAQLLHAARVLGEKLQGEKLPGKNTTPPWPASRALTLPALRATTEEMVTALEQHLARPLAHLVHWQPDAALDAQFARWPLLSTQAADRLGFTHDGSMTALVARALAA